VPGKVPPGLLTVKSLCRPYRWRAGQVLVRREDRVDQPIRLGLFRAHEAIAIHIAFDRFDRLSGVQGIERVHLRAQIQDLARLDLDVSGGALRPAGRLVNHDPRMGQGAPLALGSGRKQERAHRRGHTHADRVHRGAEVLHRIVDRHAGGYHASGRVDVQIDVFVGIIRLEEQELRYDDVGDIVVDRSAKKDDPIHQEAGEDVVGPLAAARTLDDVGRIQSGHGQDVTSSMVDCWRRKSNTFPSVMERSSSWSRLAF